MGVHRLERRGLDGGDWGVASGQKEEDLEQLTRAARFWWLLRRTLVLAYEENCFSVAKGAAYSGLLSLFPVLTTIAAVLVQTRAEPVLQILSRFLSEFAPPGTAHLLLNRFVVQGEKPVSLLVTATVLSLFAASGVMLSLIEGFNGVYHIPTSRPLVHQRTVAVLLVFAAALPAIAASGLILFGARTEHAVIGWLSGSMPVERLAGGILVAGQLVRYALALGTIVGVTSMLYYVGPNRRQQWRDVWAGALVATVLWLAATLAFAWYVRNIADYNVFYGSVGAVIALIVWMYLLALIAMLGCACNAAREQLRVSQAQAG